MFMREDDSDSEDDDDGIRTYYLDPPVWRRWVMIRSNDGHFYYGNTEGHLDARTGRYHSFEPPY